MRIIGLDAGSVRTGISVADQTCTLASPYQIIHTNPKNGFAKRLSEAISGLNISLVVIGLPIDLRGREGASAALARELGAIIEAELGWQVEYMDERFSSVIAEQKAGKRKKDSHIDARAAAVILQDWLDYRKPKD